MLNPITQRLAPTMGPLSTHIMGASDFARFAQERTSEGANAQVEAAKDAAKNTAETVTQLKDVVSAVKDLGKSFGGGAIMRGRAS